MKKLIILLFLVVSTLSFGVDGHLRLGIHSPVSSYNNSEKSFEHMGTNIGVELTQDFLVAKLGVGATYFGKTGGSEIATIPTYFIAKCKLLPIFFEPYIVAKYGTTIFTKENVENSTPKGNLYYGVGAGVDVGDLQVEVLYSNIRVKNDNRGNDNLQIVGVNLGYKFF